MPYSAAIACSSIQAPGAYSCEKILFLNLSATSSYNGLGANDIFVFIIMNTFNHFCQVYVKPKRFNIVNLLNISVEK